MSELAYAISGDGPPLVLLHGITGSRLQWTPLLPRLAQDHTCVAIDLLGHGESPDGQYDVFSQMQAVHDLVTALDLTDVLLVGHSYGAAISTIYAAVHPVRGVVNIDQPLHMPSFAAEIAPYADALRDDRFQETFAAFATGLGLDRVPEELQAMTMSTSNPRQDVVLAVWGELLDGRAEELQATLDPALSAVGCPYLAIFGRQLAPDERRVMEQIPHIEIVVWDGLGHGLHLVDQDRFLRRVAQFEQGLAT